jgi:5-methylcytosine-specific restriction enzyme A
MIRSIGRKLAPSSRAKVRLPDKQVDPFYRSKAWIRLREAIKRERWPQLLVAHGHCCEDVECTAVHTAATRIIFDHILERRDRPDLELVASNIMCRCDSSHTRKTAKVRGERHRGDSFEGKNLASQDRGVPHARETSLEPED